MIYIKHLLFIIVLTALTGCGSLPNQSYIEPEPELVSETEVRIPTEQTVINPVKRQLPRITTEPLIAVLLTKGPKVSLSLIKGGTITGNENTVNIASENITFTATDNGIISSVTGNESLGKKVVIQVPQLSRTTTFSAKVFPPFGKPQTLTLSGQPEVILDPQAHQVMLVERVGLETYLGGVLPTEISPAWPLEAIKAQAVVARSYTLDRYLRKLEQPWQLHWHFTVDMAYGGFKPLKKSVAVALKQTSGQLIVAHDLPVPAFFHACSGGQTENVANFRTDLLGADQITKMADVMPSVVDPYAIPGAAALNSTNKHIYWQTELPMAKVRAGLQKSVTESSAKIGKITSIQIHERYPDSGRVQTLLVKHVLDGQNLETPISAAQFRLSAGPVQIRSTNWQLCTIKPGKGGGTLVIEGTGFGHGVGLSQISAYEMAREGQKAGDIVRFFYPGAKLVQWW